MIHHPRTDPGLQMFSLCQMLKMFSCRWVLKFLLTRSRLGRATGTSAKTYSLVVIGPSFKKP